MSIIDNPVEISIDFGISIIYNASADDIFTIQFPKIVKIFGKIRMIALSRLDFKSTQLHGIFLHQIDFVLRTVTIEKQIIPLSFIVSAFQLVAYHHVLKQGSPQRMAVQLVGILDSQQEAG